MPLKYGKSQSAWLYAQPSMLAFIVFITLLAGYTLYLHHQLHSDTQMRPMHLHGSRLSDQSMRLQTELDRAQRDVRVLETAGGDGGDASQLVQHTAQLADEVAGLARDLEAKQKRLAEHQQAVRPLLRGKAGGQGAAGGSAESRQAARGGGGAQPAGQKVLDVYEGRRRAVVDAMRHAWRSYEKYAWGHDELDPIRRQPKDGFGSVGATIVDSLDTLWLMGLKAEFRAARDWTANNLTFHRDHDSSVFETTIRVVGGLLAAHDLSVDAMFVQRAREIGDILMVAFRTPTHIPYGTVNLASGRAYNPSWTGGASGLAEFGTQQMEYIKLSDASGNATYAALAEGNIALLHRLYPDTGLLPSLVSVNDGRLMNDHITFGAMGDSYYEYLLKVWLLKGGSDEMYRSMWERAMDEMIDQLVFTKGGLTYVAEKQSGGPFHKMDHLACFTPGMLALGAHYGAVKGGKAARYMEVARNLTETCWQMYARQPTGLAPELVMFTGAEMHNGAPHNLLRPETVETLFVLWRTTGDVQYREHGWAIFQAFEKHCRVQDGYAGLADVTQVPPQHDDTQQSFFLAETLKYLFLLFGPDDVLPLDQWVLNTEAHPLKKVPGFKSTYQAS